MREGAGIVFIPEVAPPSAGAALGADLWARLVAHGEAITTASALAELHEALWNAEDIARSRARPHAEVAGAKRTIDGLNAERHRLIDALDAQCITGRDVRGDVLLSETPGELCDRVIIVALKVTRMWALAADDDLSAESRGACAERAAHAVKWLDHLRACLARTLDAITDGRACLPPRAEFKLYNDAQFNPVLRRELAAGLAGDL